MKHPSRCRGNARAENWGRFYPSLSQAGLAAWQRPGRFIRLRYSSLFTLISSKSLAISSVTKAIKKKQEKILVLCDSL